MSQQSGARQLVVFTLADEHYALAITQVQEIIRFREPRSVASNDGWVRGVLSLRGKIVPIYDLAARLGVQSEPGEESKIVIIDAGGETAGMTVDGVDEVRTIQEEDIDHAPAADATLIESIAKIEERLVVLLNTATMFTGLKAAA